VVRSAPLPRRLVAHTRAISTSPRSFAVAIAAVAAALYVVVYPLSVTRYPAMTDLPFHAANTSALRHYFDPAYHFREQFELVPLSVPYLSSYVLGALLMLVLPAHVAVSVATGVMLSLLPAGLAVMFHGMKKSPLLGLAGLPFVWCTLTHWGFVNFVAALGLFAMTVGWTLLVVDRPTRRRQVALALTLVLLFFAHVFRFPLAMLAVVGTAAVMYPATRRFRAALWPLVPAAVLFAVWWVIRPTALGGDWGPLTVDWARLGQIRAFLFSGFTDAAEPTRVDGAFSVIAVVAGVSLIHRFVERRERRAAGETLRWDVGITVVAMGSAAAFLLLYLTLPMQVGVWWYVYPRECTAAAFVGLGLLPDLPRQRTLRLAGAVALMAATLPLAELVARQYADFGRVTEDFYAVTRRIPQAPKLCYLVFDHSGTRRTSTPFIHLPAYVQAERGGWLSFHFAGWGTSPIRYREGAPDVVPPPVPPRWEWTPQRFRVLEHGRFFDWFLIRRSADPGPLLSADPSISLEDHVGTWWLYKRRSAVEAAPAGAPLETGD
jgi:hypothetical protein